MAATTTTSKRTTTPKNRRRRKRPRTQQQQQQPNYDCQEDVSISNEIVPPKKNKKKTLLELLRNREVNGANCVHAKAAMGSLAKRRITFRELQTPPTEAVLGLDETGSYVIGIEARREQLQLVRRAIPRVGTTRNGKRGAPLVQRISLPCEGLSEGDSLVATVPIDILLSGDMGVVRIQTHQSSPDDGEQDDSVCIGTMILCHLITGQTSTCPNVRLGGGATPFRTTIRNLLWKVNAVPIAATVSDGQNRQISPWCCRQFKEIPAHLLLNDEDDGYRLTWVVAHDYHYHNIRQVSRSSTVKTKPVTRQDIVVKESTWQQQEGGDVITKSDSMVACEAYLSVESLLDDIRARRKEVFFYNEHNPEFFYHLVSVDENGRIVTVAICFSNRTRKQPQKRPLSIAVLVQVDLYTQSYQEIEWAQHGCHLNAVQLQQWIEQFGLNRRMKDMRVGPFSVSGVTKASRDWRFLLDDDSNDPVCQFGGDAWRKFVKLDAKEQQKRFRKTIAMAELYPDCDLLSNAAVRREVPVLALGCRSGSTELVYSYTS